MPATVTDPESQTRLPRAPVAHSVAQCVVLGAVCTAALFTACVAVWSLMPFYSDFISGDIPHYLLAVQSLVEDGDFDLQNNYENPESHDAYFSGALYPRQYAPGTTRPFRSVGLPLLLTPGWLLAGYPGALGTAGLFICLAAGLLASVALRDTGSLAIAFAIGCLTVFHLPALSYIYYPYPDVFSGAAHLAFFLIVTRCLRGNRRAGLWASAAAVLMAWLVWMHVKFALLHPVHVALVWAWLPPKRRWRLSLLTLGILGGNLALYVAYHRWVGVQFGAYSGQVRLAPWPEMVFGSLFDRQFGIFYYFPLMALPIAEMVRQLLVGPRRTAATALILISALYGLHAWFWGWYGGSAPMGRHALNWIFVLLFFFIPLAKRLADRPRFAFGLVCGLLALFHIVFMVTVFDESRFWRQLNIFPPLDMQQPDEAIISLMPLWGRGQMYMPWGVDLWLPSLIHIDGKGLRVLFLTLTTLMLLSLWHSWYDLRDRGRPRPRNLALFLFLWIVLSGIAYWDMHENRARTPEQLFTETWGDTPESFQERLIE